jgi:hypothetical protein
MHAAITMRVIASAAMSDMYHQLISHASFQRIICAKRKIGIKIRHIWNVNVMMVKIGFFCHFTVPKGMIQCRIERRA